MQAILTLFFKAMESLTCSLKIKPLFMLSVPEQALNSVTKNIN